MFEMHVTHSIQHWFIQDVQDMHYMSQRHFCLHLELRTLSTATNGTPGSSMLSIDARGCMVRGIGAIEAIFGITIGAPGFSRF